MQTSHSRALIIATTTRITSNMSETAKILALKPADVRKSKKPLMERRRRERINTCLEELKKLVVDSSQKENGRYAKLEKADILEMTVKHLQAMHRVQKRDATRQEAPVETKFLSGFGECANEVARYMATMTTMENDVKNRVIGHLYSHVQNIQSQQQPGTLPACIPATTPVTSLPGTHNNNNTHKMVPVPATLPSTAPVISTGKGQTLLLATGTPMVAAGSQLTMNPQLGRIAFILSNGQTSGQVIPVYTNFTQINPTSNTANVSKQTIASPTAVNNNNNSSCSNNVAEHVVPAQGTRTRDVTSSSLDIDIEADNAMWRPW